MTETIGKIRQNRETNSSAVREQKIIVENEIRELRTKISNHLDKLQEDLLKSPHESPSCKFHNTDIHAPCSIN
jgi:hypothetical protein